MESSQLPLRFVSTLSIIHHPLQVLATGVHLHVGPSACSDWWRSAHVHPHRHAGGCWCDLDLSHPHRPVVCRHGHHQWPSWRCEGGHLSGRHLTARLAACLPAHVITFPSFHECHCLHGPLVQETQALVFGSSSSLDPDDVANTLSPFSFQWTCTALDTSTQVGALGG